MFWRLSLCPHNMSVDKRRCSVSYRMDDNDLIFCDKVENPCGVHQHNIQGHKMRYTSFYTLDDKYASDTRLKKKRMFGFNYWNDALESYPRR